MVTQTKKKSEIPKKCIACAKRVPVVCFFSNFTLAVFKMSVGHLTGSKGLFADGIHSLSDVVATFSVIVSLKISDKGDDPQYPYGRGKIEFISCVFVYSILCAVAMFILYEATSSIISGGHKTPNLIAIFSAVVSVIANIILYRVGLCAGRAVNSPAIIANANENKADMLSSIAVIFGVIGSNLGYTFSDPLAAVMVGLIILKTALTLGWKAIEELIDTSLPVEKLKVLNEIIMGVKGVERVNYIKTRQIGKQYWLDVGVQVPPELLVRTGDVISQVVRYEIMEISNKVKDVVVILSCNNPQKKGNVVKNKGILGKLRVKFAF